MRTYMHTFTVNLLQLVFGGVLCFAVGGLVTYTVVSMTLMTTECVVTTPAPQSDEALRRFMEPGLLPMDQGKRY
jgi:hypothetical protein